MATKLQLSKIRTDGDTQPRTEISSQVVGEYAEAMKAKAKFPPVIVFNDGMNYWLVDGFHRLEAAKKLKRKQIDCDIHKGTQEDACWFSYKVNSDHGLRRSNADKRKAVEAALQHPNGVKMSDSQIAEHVGVDHKTVAKVRKELVSTWEIPKSTTRTGRDGRTIDTKNIGRNGRRVAEDEELEQEPGQELDEADSEPDESEYEPEAEYEDEQEADDDNEYEYVDAYEDGEYEEGEYDEDEAEEDTDEEPEEDEDEEDESKFEEEDEEASEFDQRKESRYLRKLLREALAHWPEESLPEALRVIRQVLEKDFDLSLTSGV